MTPEPLPCMRCGRCCGIRSLKKRWKSSPDGPQTPASPENLRPVRPWSPEYLPPLVPAALPGRRKSWGGRHSCRECGFLTKPLSHGCGGPLHARSHQGANEEGGQRHTREGPRPIPPADDALFELLEHLHSSFRTIEKLWCDTPHWCIAWVACMGMNIASRDETRINAGLEISHAK